MKRLPYHIGDFVFDCCRGVILKVPYMLCLVFLAPLRKRLGYLGGIDHLPGVWESLSLALTYNFANDTRRLYGRTPIIKRMEQKLCI